MQPGRSDGRRDARHDAEQQSRGRWAASSTYLVKEIHLYVMPLGFFVTVGSATSSSKNCL